MPDVSHAAFAPTSPWAPGYERVRASFTWAGARAQLTGLPGGRGLNIAHEAVDRHCDAGRGRRTALRSVAADGWSPTSTTTTSARRATGSPTC